MTWHVRWHTGAIHSLEKLKAASSDPARIQTASDWIDYTLRRIPSDVGESRDGIDRVWYGDVLGILYSVDEDSRIVTVHELGPSRRH